MVSKNTRSSRNKQRTALSVIGRELTDDANMNASERNTEADDIEGTAAASAAATESPTARNSTTKVRPPKKKTSPIWKHYDEIFVEEMVDDMVIKKPMASCKYCDDVLNAPSKQANLFFSEFCEINLKIVEWNKSNNSFIVSMAKSMKEKFDKYWEKSNIALAVACFLDPRYKMKVVEFYYSEMSDDYGFDDMYEFKKVLQKLYDSYASIYTPDASNPMQQSAARNRRNVRTSQCYADLNEEPRRKRLNSFLRENTESGQQQSDIDTYCNEPLLSWKEGDYFDILSWWKAHGARYPILARLARDVLAIPTTTVASESAFSSGGRIVHKYRSRLDPQIIEALICTKDWIRASRKDKSGVSSIADDLADLGLHNELQQDEGDPAVAVENIIELDVADD